MGFLWDPTCSHLRAIGGAVTWGMHWGPEDVARSHLKDVWAFFGLEWIPRDIISATTISATARGDAL